MRGKLSHPTRPHTRGPLPWVRLETARTEEGSRCSFPRLFVAGAALIISTLGCNQLEAGIESPSSLTQAQVEEAPSDAPFSWPEDPSHPVLEIALDSPDVTGTILIELMPELAPATVVSVIELANEGFYDGTTFHRVIPGFMIQGGDPNSRDRDPSNDGKGGPGRPMRDEFSPAPFIRGVVGMGNKGRADSTSTQFFIMQSDDGNLDGRYTIVGRVITGMDLVDDVMKTAIDRAGRWGPKDRPIENVVMAKVHTVGNVAAIKAAIEPDAQDEGALEIAGMDKVFSETKTSSPPASPRVDDDWERLEAGGR
jgi:peptidyl-prolyl cis-trans isomerase B (cyclophilin B)